MGGREEWVGSVDLLIISDAVRDSCKGPLVRKRATLALEIREKKGWPPNFTLFVRKAYREFSPVKLPLKVVNRLPAHTAPSRAEARIALTTICANISLDTTIHQSQARNSKKKDPKEISRFTIHLPCNIPCRWGWSLCSSWQCSAPCRGPPGCWSRGPWGCCWSPPALGPSRSPPRAPSWTLTTGGWGSQPPETQTRYRQGRDNIYISGHALPWRRDVFSWIQKFIL